MLRLGIDIDGVVADFRSAFRALAEQELGIAAEDAESDLTKADIDRLWRVVAGKPNWWLDVAPYEPDQIVRLYSRARQSRWEVFFMTSRSTSGGDSVPAGRLANWFQPTKEGPQLPHDPRGRR